MQNEELADCDVQGKMDILTQLHHAWPLSVAAVTSWKNIWRDREKIVWILMRQALSHVFLITQTFSLIFTYSTLFLSATSRSCIKKRKGQRWLWPVHSCVCSSCFTRNILPLLNNWTSSVPPISPLEEGGRASREGASLCRGIWTGGEGHVCWRWGWVDQCGSESVRRW